MPRKYKRKTEDSPTDPYKVLEALKAVKIEKRSVKSVSNDHNIPRSSLSRYLTKINQAFLDISTVSDQQLLDCIKLFTSRGSKTVCLICVLLILTFSSFIDLFYLKVFSPAEEEALVEYLFEANQLGSEVKRNEICRKTLEFAKKIEVTYPESWNENEMASRDWYEAFMRRHSNFTGRSAEQMDQKIELDLCHACLLHSDSEMTSLLNHIIEINDSPLYTLEQISLAEIYTECVGIKISSPLEMLCEDCTKKLIEFHKFRRMCQKSYKSLCETDEQCFAEKIEIDDNKETIFDDIEVDDNEIGDIFIKEDEMDEQLNTAKLEEIQPSEEVHSQQETMVESSNRSEMQITCDICSKNFFKKHSFEAHLRTHAGQKPYQCDHCEKSFIKYFTLKEHLATKHCPVPKGNAAFICEVNECGKTYSQKVGLRISETYNNL